MRPISKLCLWVYTPCIRPLELKPFLHQNYHAPFILTHLLSASNFFQAVHPHRLYTINYVLCPAPCLYLSTVLPLINNSPPMPLPEPALTGSFGKPPHGGCEWSPETPSLISAILTVDCERLPYFQMFLTSWYTHCKLQWVHNDDRNSSTVKGSTCGLQPPH